MTMQTATTIDGPDAAVGEGTTAARVSDVATRDDVLRVLKREADVIRRLGATALYLFGSAARDELGPDSDIDVLIDYASDGSFTFVEWARLEEHLSEVLGREVDVLTRRSLHPRLKDRIERSSVRVL